MLFRRGATPVQHWISLFILLALIGAFHIATLRPGHVWGDDFAGYILQTQHLATGQGLIAYEFIPNPEAFAGGQSLPPGLSVLLLPVYTTLGLNLTAMKVLLVFCVLGALFLVDRLFEDRLRSAWRLALVAIVGLNPVIFD